MPEEIDARCSHLRRGWYWGTQAFAERLMRGLKQRIPGLTGRASRVAPERRSHDQAEAQRWLLEGLVAAGLDRAELKRLPGSDARKVALAALLWGGTTVSQGWIAEQLHMGSAANVSQQLRRSKAVKDAPKLPRALRTFINSVQNSAP